MQLWCNHTSAPERPDRPSNLSSLSLFCHRLSLFIMIMHWFLSSHSIIAVIYHHQREHKMKIRNTIFFSGNFALQSGEQDGALTGIRWLPNSILIFIHIHVPWTFNHHHYDGWNANDISPVDKRWFWTRGHSGVDRLYQISPCRQWRWK